MKPLCFVLMPFGQKPNPAGGTVDFNRVYAELIQPAVAAADLEPLRADQESVGGIIHKPMFERLILCPYAVADLTLANPNVYYELGVRHAFRPGTTMPIIADDNRLPFDVQLLRTVQYRLNSDGAPDPARLEDSKKAMTTVLLAAKSDGAKDSPLFQLVEGIIPAVVPSDKTDVFRKEVDYSNEMKAKLSAARQQGAAQIADIEKSLGDVADVETGVVIDLLLAYRDAKAWQAMVDLTARMPAPVRATVMVQEELALALNRLERSEEAEQVLKKLIESKGVNAEAYGMLGRVYKDRWDRAVKANDKFVARGFLDKAIAAYTAGFESDWRDAYPGVNAVTLMELKEPPDDRRLKMIPVVRYGVERKIANGRADYWDYATLVELDVLAQNEAEAMEMFSQALACMVFPWEAETTGRNLRLIREARERRGGSPPWAKEIEDELERKAAEKPGT